MIDDEFLFDIGQAKITSGVYGEWRQLDYCDAMPVHRLGQWDRVTNLARAVLEIEGGGPYYSALRKWSFDLMRWAELPLNNDSIDQKLIVPYTTRFHSDFLRCKYCQKPVEKDEKYEIIIPFIDRVAPVAALGTYLASQYVFYNLLQNWGYVVHRNHPVQEYLRLMGLKRVAAQ